LRKVGWQSGLDDRLLRTGNVIGHASPQDVLGVATIDGVAGTFVAITRLTDGSHIHEALAVWLQSFNRSDVHAKFITLHPECRRVRVSDEADRSCLMRKTQRGSVRSQHISPLARMMQGGMHSLVVFGLHRHGQRRQPVFLPRSQHAPCPLDGLARGVLHVIQSGTGGHHRIVIALHTGNAVLHEKINAVAGAAAIADHVAETHAFVDAVVCHVLQHGMRRAWALPWMSLRIATELFMPSAPTGCRYVGCPWKKARQPSNTHQPSPAMNTAKTKAKKTALHLAHPGEMLLLDFLQPATISQYRLAQATGISVSRINDLIKGRRGITPDSAIRLGAALGTGPELWLNLQRDYDMRLVRAEKAAEYAAISVIPELAA
jgi:addiction module HigA family antidote